MYKGEISLGRRMMLVVLGLLILLAAFNSSSLRAEAATTKAYSVTCWGDWCSGKDPNSTHCADSASTLAGVTVTNSDNRTVGYLELRWSSVCKTKWARLNLWATIDIAGVIATQSGGYEQEKNTNSWRNDFWSPPGYYYTNMIYSPTRPVYAHLDQVNTCNVCATPWK